MTKLHDTSAPVMPGQWLGMLGGGQLGRMFCHAAQQMGYRVAVLDPDPASPAGAVADWHIQQPYDETDALDALAQRCLAITTEFENVPAQSLAWLEERVVVRPNASAVAVVQDRIREKAFFVEAGVPVAPYAEIIHERDLDQAPVDLFPGILKAARFGYDGKGQVRVQSVAEAHAAWHELGGVACVLEALMPLKQEVSVVLARDHRDHIACYPATANEHRDGILAVSTSDALEPSSPLASQARDAAAAIARQLDYVGVMCVEFFILEDNRLVANEVAPRPHNSGHYTMDGCLCSQFEQQVRMVAGMPVGPTGNTHSTIMLNILGDIWFQDGADEPREPAWDQVLAIPEARLHLYGKTQVRHGRKMGHVNIVADNLAQARLAASNVAGILGIAWHDHA